MSVRDHRGQTVAVAYEVCPQVGSTLGPFSDREEAMRRAREIAAEQSCRVYEITDEEEVGILVWEG